MREASLLAVDSLSGSVGWVPRGAPTPPASLSSMPWSPEGASALSGSGDVAIGVKTLGTESTPTDGDEAEGVESSAPTKTVTARRVRMAMRRSCCRAMKRLGRMRSMQMESMEDEGKESRREIYIRKGRMEKERLRQLVPLKVV